jgi:hypothetical protein
MGDLKDRILKNSTIKLTTMLEDNKIFNERTTVTTPIPMLNVALSGSLDGGLGSGLGLLCGKSKHFKSLFLLIMMKAYLDKFPDAVALFYDAEFGTPSSYFAAVGIPMDRVVYTPITDIEQLKFDVMQQLEGVNRGDRLFLGIDSIGNLASKKEVEDALKGNTAADMTRAKQLKSLFRMVTPHLTIKDIPMVAVNHIYESIEMFSKAIVSGGTGIYLSADWIFIIGRQQDKPQGEDLQGHHFIINIEKSRHVREKARVPITVQFEGGLNKWSGLFDTAMEGNFICRSSKGWFSKVNQETGEILSPALREKQLNTGEFWLPIITSEKFKEYIKDTYAVSNETLIQDEADTTE